MRFTRFDHRHALAAADLHLAAADLHLAALEGQGPMVLQSCVSAVRWLYAFVCLPSCRCIAARWPGLVPQHPPMIDAPALIHDSAHVA